jgi:hypothetical protein
MLGQWGSDIMTNYVLSNDTYDTARGPHTVSVPVPIYLPAVQKCHSTDHSIIRICTLSYKFPRLFQLQYEEYIWWWINRMNVEGSDGHLLKESTQHVYVCMYVYSGGGPHTALAPRPSLIYCAYQLSIFRDPEGTQQHVKLSLCFTN